MSLDLLRAFPNSDGRAPLHAYVQDVPATLELAKLVRSFLWTAVAYDANTTIALTLTQWWKQNYPEAVDAQRVLPSNKLL